MHQIDSHYAALVLKDILYEKGLINKATYDKIQINHKLLETTAREEKSA